MALVNLPEYICKGSHIPIVFQPSSDFVNTSLSYFENANPRIWIEIKLLDWEWVLCVKMSQP